MAKHAFKLTDATFGAERVEFELSVLPFRPWDEVGRSAAGMARGSRRSWGAGCNAGEGPASIAAYDFVWAGCCDGACDSDIA